MGSELILIVGMLAAFVAVFWLALRHASGKIATQYATLAARFGLDVEVPPTQMGGFVRPDPAIYGEYRGRQVSVSPSGKGIKNSRQIETVLKVELNNKAIKTQMAAAGLLRGVRLRDSEDLARWQSGDPDFDKAVDLGTNQPDTLEEMMTAERKTRWAELLRQSKATIYIDRGVIASARLGLIADEASRQVFEELVEFSLDLAEAIETS